MTHGTVSNWYKSEGATIEKGEPIVEVTTEKVVYDIEAPISGVLHKIVVHEGTEVAVAGVLGIIWAEGESVPLEPQVKNNERKDRILASPAAKRLAREHSINLEDIKIKTGSRITEDDVKRFIEEMMSTPKVTEEITLTGIRQVVAERLSQSARTAPHSMIIMEVDMTNVVKLHQEEKITYTSFFVKAAAQALIDVPLMNSTIYEDKIKILKEINIGVAIATEKGLFVPVIKHTDQKTIANVALELAEITNKAREGKLTKEEMSGGTFTITNLGMFGVEVFMPIINPPEAAILGVGRIVDKVVVRDSKIKIRPVAQMSLTFDHRIVDGVPAAKFLSSIKKYLET